MRLVRKAKSFAKTVPIMTHNNVRQSFRCDLFIPLIILPDCFVLVKVNSTQLLNLFSAKKNALELNRVGGGIAPTVLPSLYLTSCHFIVAPGPKVFHAQAKSRKRCRPFQSVSTPGGAFALAGSGRASRPIDITAEARDQPDHLRQFRRFFRQRLAGLRDDPNRLPFRRIKNHITIHVSSSQSKKKLKRLV